MSSSSSTRKKKKKKKKKKKLCFRSSLCYYSCSYCCYVRYSYCLLHHLLPILLLKLSSNARTFAKLLVLLLGWRQTPPLKRKARCFCSFFSHSSYSRHIC
jgi:hypothetical protein